MGGQFAWSAAELTEEIRQMGSNPLKRDGVGTPERPGVDGPERADEEA